MIAQPREAMLAFLSASGPKKLDHYFYTGIVPLYQTDITGKHRYPSAQKKRSLFRVQGLGEIRFTLKRLAGFMLCIRCINPVRRINPCKKTYTKR
jgi:hypothetical protein